MKYKIYTVIAFFLLMLFGGLFWIIYHNWDHQSKLEVATAIPTAETAWVQAVYHSRLLYQL